MVEEVKTSSETTRVAAEVSIFYFSCSRVTFVAGVVGTRLREKGSNCEDRGGAGPARVHNCPQ
jgi:hypothetical protein